LHNGQYEPANEKVDIVNDHPSEPNILKVTLVDSSLVNVHGQDEKTYEGQIEG